MTTPSSSRRVLVTGGAGYLGSQVVREFLDAGWDVTVLDSLLYGGEALLPWLDHPRFRLIAGDIRDADRVEEALRQVEAVVHLAALVGEAACQVDPAAAVAINTTATEQLVRLAAERGVGRLLFVSTCSNYGVSAPDVPADEEASLHPLSRYAETKIAAEQAVLGFRHPAMAACVLRFGTVCGLSTRMRFNLLVNELARAAALGRAIRLHSPDAWRPFLHMRDATRALRQCLVVPADAIRGRVFNVVSENCQKRQLAALVGTHFPDCPIALDAADVDGRDYRVSADRIARTLGFRPEATVEQAFLAVAAAVGAGVFPDPDRPLYEALPTLTQLQPC